MNYVIYDSPVGPLLVAGERGRLCEIRFSEGRSPAQPDPDWAEDAKGLENATRQLDEYFAGDRTDFELALEPSGTAFQQDVWSELCQIPYGETISYGELASRLGKPKAMRAVGAANGANPIPIVVPCHRVIGADGKLVGFGGGLDVKRALLDLETFGSPIR